MILLHCLYAIQSVYRLFRILQNVITSKPTSLPTCSAFMLSYHFYRNKLEGPNGSILLWLGSSTEYLFYRRHDKRDTLYNRIISSTNFNAQFNNSVYVSLSSSTCFGPWHAHPQEEQLHKHSIWYPRSPKRLYTTPVESIKAGWRNNPILWCTVEKNI